jgi:hypothetical protein
MAPHAGKPLPPEPHVPRLVLLWWQVRELVTWPLAVRELKRAGFRRTGWMTWEAGPEGDDG